MRYVVSFTTRDDRTGSMAVNAFSPQEALTSVSNYMDVIYGSGVRYVVDEVPEDLDPFACLDMHNGVKR